ncbi:MAG: PQQ-dependent sugar dehydrogenase, partial [Halalkalicoccus sp.]
MVDTHQTRRRVLQAIGAAGASSIAIGPVAADDSSTDEYDVEQLDVGFDNAWGLAFLPEDSRLLVTEREGRLNLLDREDGAVEVIDGAPDVYAEG